MNLKSLFIFPLYITYLYWLIHKTELTRSPWRLCANQHLLFRTSIVEPEKFQLKQWRADNHLFGLEIPTDKTHDQGARSVSLSCVNNRYYSITLFLLFSTFWPAHINKIKPLGMLLYLKIDTWNKYLHHKAMMYLEKVSIYYFFFHMINGLWYVWVKSVFITERIYFFAYTAILNGL